MQFFKLIILLILSLLFVDCAKEESSTKPIVSQEKPDDSINEENDSEKPLDSIPETQIDSIPEIPIDSIPGIPSDSIPEIPIDRIPITYFRFRAVGNSSDTADSDHAIMIHSVEGDLLDYKLYEGGDVLVFQSTAEIPPDNFTVSMIDRNTYYGPLEKNSIVSMPNVANNSFWTNYRRPEELPHRPSGEVIGGFDVTITDLPDELLRFRLSSYDETRIQGVYKFENNSYTLSLENLAVYEKNEYILTIVEKNYQKKYLKISNIQANDELVFSYDDLLNYDKTIEIELPSNFRAKTYRQYGIEEPNKSITGGGYGLDSFDFGDSPSNLPNVITLGFIDELLTYQTKVDIALEGYNYHYFKFGTPVDNIILKNPNYSVQNESLFNFQFTTDINYIFRVSDWSVPYDENLKITWSILSPVGENPKINELPENLSATFPNININNLGHVGTQFYKRSVSYNKFIEGLYDLSKPRSSAIFEREVYYCRNR